MVDLLMAYKPGGGGGAVDSVFGRTGVVSAQSGDYTKSQVGLGNVDNTSDANKPVSTAQQTALDLKANLNSPTFTGTVSGITAAMVGAPAGSGTSTGTNTGDQTTVSGNAGSATVLQTARTINGSSFNGSADIILDDGISLVNLAPTTSQTIPAGTSAYACGPYEIVTATSLEIGVGACLEIG